MNRAPLHWTLLFLLTACSSGAGIDEQAAPTPVASGGKTTPVAPWTRGAMVSAANAHAVDAAAAVLARGGHAVDAAIAAHTVLGLVEPESSGLGGSAFMLVYERKSNSLVFYDGREKAPAGASADMFMRDGQPMGFRDAWQTGLSVAVPGTVALYEEAHRAHGRLPWAEILEPAIRLANEGFEVSAKLSNWLTRLAPMIDAANAPAVAAYFYPGGEALPVGFRRDNPEYAATLARIAAEGAAAFYSGEIGAAIVERAGRAPLGGQMTLADVEAYEVVVRDAVCGPFRELRVCSAPPPSSGVAQIMIAGLYDRLGGAAATELADKVRLFVDAQRLAYADRDQYLADADYVDVPLAALIDARYLDLRATQRFAPDAAPEPGDPAAVIDGSAYFDRHARDTTREMAGTSHFSIVDAEGNAVSMTASVGAPFGSLRWVRGFLLNNEMSDFAFAPVENGRTVANVIEPGKRPRSSMSPTMVFAADGELRMVTGSPGGNSIVAYVAKSILGVFDWGLPAQDAADFPNIIARGDVVRVETDAASGTGKELATGLAERGYNVQESQGENSGLHLIVVRPDGLEGAADSRREGTVRAIP
ncbi:MAG: gamma-glutamyltransferase family protein [Gammaproteobacteria bacterium]|nr:gamma-glutamyltransferase family protein [Gammaproteobacteria bacterium]MDH4254641.1 gamma-glutamyltransferase family protein [Gammaproteobacteria bacterium]MDH5309469.1 gamma-glutamyltransferase family protein [Gammaproteobacteria bacterium]